MTAKDIQKVLKSGQFLSQPEYTIENLYVFDWESDILFKTKAGYYYEVEIKISKADFKADFKKKKKHIALKYKQYSHTLDLTPNYFYYCVPEELVDSVKDLVPEYAGLLCIEQGARNGWKYVHWIKEAPLLHKEKWTDEQLNLSKVFYYNYRTYKDRYDQGSASMIESLRNEIAAVKSEFKAVTGFDYEECL